MLRYLLATMATFTALTIGAQADAGPTYGGCGEAWQAPSSQGAAWCRGHGWIVRARIVIGPHRYVHMTALPHCRFEDGSGQRSACTWNVGRPIDGNGIGRAYVVWANGTDTTVRGMVGGPR
jgi:hypothetical protein